MQIPNKFNNSKRNLFINANTPLPEPYLLIYQQLEMHTEPLILQTILFLIATCANLLSAFSGGGAGLVQLPALILLGLPFAKALATHKVASVALGIGASIRYYNHRNLRPSIIAIILGFGLPGVLIGAGVILSIPDKSATILLGLLTLWLGIYSSKSPRLGKGNQKPSFSQSEKIIGGIVIFIIGVLNGSLTSGTGLFLTMWLVAWFGLTYTNAIAYTLVLVGVVWNGTGALVLGINADIQWNWIASLFLGSLLGGYLGAHLSILKGDHLVKKAFEVISILFGLSLFLKGLYI